MRPRATWTVITMGQALSGALHISQTDFSIGRKGLAAPWIVWRLRMQFACRSRLRGSCTHSMAPIPMKPRHMRGRSRLDCLSYSFKAIGAGTLPSRSQRAFRSLASHQRRHCQMPSVSPRPMLSWRMGARMQHGQCLVSMAISPSILLVIVVPCLLVGLVGCAAACGIVCIVSVFSQGRNLLTAHMRCCHATGL